MTTTGRFHLGDLLGCELGRREVDYGERDAILYALAVGAAEHELDLVYERDLRVLPTFALSLGLWAVREAGALGAYDPVRSLHASQRLEMHEPLRRSGTVRMSGSISGVWDKGKATMVDVEVRAAEFTATYGIFLPGVGGWGGARGPASTRQTFEPTRWDEYPTPRNLAAMYRLTGDPHPVHIDPDVASAAGFERPILHGLCTLGISARVAAGAIGAHPGDLTELRARFTAPVLPGDTVRVGADGRDGASLFETRVGDAIVIGDGLARFR